MKQNYPHVTFHLNKKLDKEMLFEFFVDGKKAGFDFKKEIISIHPDLDNISDQDKKLKSVLDRFVNNFYAINNNKLLAAKEKFQKIWDSIENKFFKEADNIFNNLDWPQGKYFGYISILPIGARFLNNKTFQSCWLWKKNIKSQVIHELLHFQFYNLVEKITGKNQEENEKVWKLSEIFNNILQKEDEFVKLQGYSPKISYPEHKNEYSQYLKVWRENPKAESFIRKALKK